MRSIDQKIAAWGGPFCAAFLGTGLVVANFLPPPSPDLAATEIAVFYQHNSVVIRIGMLLGLIGIAGYAAMVGAITAQMRRMQGISRMPPELQLGAGSIGVLTVMFPLMIFAIAAFRPERDAQMTQMLNDLGWLIIIPAFPTFIAQMLAISAGIFQDQSAQPVFPRWAAYFNAWVCVLFVPAGFAYFFRAGPFAWNGLISFWLAATAFFVWLLVMAWLLLRAINNESRAD